MVNSNLQAVPQEEYWRALLRQGKRPPHAPLEIADSWPDPITPGEAPPRGRGTAPNGKLAHAPAPDTWRQLLTWQEEGTAFDATVIGCNKGGLLVRIRDGIGFVPASQMAELPPSLGTPALRGDLQRMVGTTLTLRLIELDPARNRVICSERAVRWEDDAVASRLQALETQVGQAVEGIVRSLCDFGVFVDLEGVDGLIHISELSWQRVAHPSEVLAVGDRVQVLVLSVDREARRIALSYKRLAPDPWQEIGSRYVVGDVIDAVVTNVVDFGAFARVPEGVDGLIHISELADGPFLHPRNVVSVGQAVKVRVLHIDAPARRLGLSLRQA